MKDYDCIIEYHPGKSNIVADALSQKTMEHYTGMTCYDMSNLVALRAMNVELEIGKNHLLATLQIRPLLRNQIRSVQIEYPYLKKMKNKVEALTNS